MFIYEKHLCMMHVILVFVPDERQYMMFMKVTHLTTARE